MEQIKAKYKNHFGDRNFLVSLLFAVFILGISLVANYYAGIYVIEKASNSVTDIILDNIRVYDVDTIFVYGPILMWTFVGALLFARPERIPFVIKSVALFVLIRSLFITLTHIGPFPTHAVISSSFIFGYLNPGADLFFSSHTGQPFLLSLIFWQNKILRILFIILSLVFGAVVLLGHLHYSIDVLSAFFITYGIYSMAEIIFYKDKLRWDL